MGRRPDRRRRARPRCRGQGRASARSPDLRRAVSIPLAGHVGSLNVSVAAAILLYEARRQRAATARAAVAEPTLYLFDGHNLLHAGDFGGVPSSSTRLRASSRCTRRARCRRLRRGGEEREIGPLSVRYARARRRRARAARGRAPVERARLPRLVGRGGARRRRARRCESSRRGSSSPNSRREPHRSQSSEGAGVASGQARPRDARAARAASPRRVGMRRSEREGAPVVERRHRAPSRRSA